MSKNGSHMKIVLITLALTGLLSGSVRAESAPDWLKGAWRTAHPKYDTDVPGVVLLDEGIVKVKDNGEAWARYRYAVKILTGEGKDLAMHIIPYDEETRVSEVKAWHLTPTGSIVELKKEQVMETAFSGSALYADAKQKILGFAGAQPGSVMGFEWEQKERPDMLQDIWHFQSRLPVVLSRYRLELPKDWQVKGIVFNHPEITPARDGENTYTWELRDLPPIPVEEMMPKLRSLSPWLAVSYFPPADRGPRQYKTLASWQDVSRWYAELVSPQVILSDELTSKVRELTSNISDEMDKIRTIAAWVQKHIRYVAIEVGIGGYRPHSSLAVYRNSYGDCKDKVCLLQAMLKAIGIESHPVLAYAGDPEYVRPEFPSPKQFNHAIIAVSVKADLPTVVEHEKLGRLLFFDPTDQETAVGDLPFLLQGGWALVTKGGGGNLIRLPILPESLNSLKREVTARLSEKGRVGCLVREEMRGQVAALEKAFLGSQSETERRRSIEHSLSRYVPGATLAKFDYQEREDGSITEQYEFVTDSYINRMESMMLFRPTILGSRQEIGYPKTARKHPFLMPLGYTSEAVVKIELPEGYRVDELPEEINLSREFGHFRTSYQLDGRQLVYTRHLSLRRTKIPSEVYQELREFFKRVHNSDQANVVLVK